MTLAFFMVHVLHSFTHCIVDLSSAPFPPFVPFPLLFPESLDAIFWICSSFLFLQSEQCYDVNVKPKVPKDTYSYKYYYGES